MSRAFSPAKAGKWLLESGIQDQCGGVARLYLADAGRNRAVSTEITGYTAGGLVYLFQLTGDERYLDRARTTACFLVNRAWDKDLRVFPFEHPSPTPDSPHQSWFFDSGIIVRGLLAVWRETGEEQLLDTARTAALAMAADFRNGAEYAPVLELPAKRPQACARTWSRRPGCYQLKAALAWWETAEATGENALRDAYFEVLESAVATHADYLPGADHEHAVMDRLHAYCYFLEGLIPQLDRPECMEAYRQGIRNVACYLRKIAPSFSRSDVYAQLLRARIFAAGRIAIDPEAAAQEAEALAGFQAASEDPRIDGGFYFGRRSGAMSPHVNPVSTVFALQALEMWREFQAGSKPPCGKMLI